jgi:hypothetical protein
MQHARNQGAAVVAKAGLVVECSFGIKAYFHVLSID